MDEAWIRSFLIRQYPRLVNALAMGWGSVALAEEAVQEALARLWDRTEAGLVVDRPVAWVAVAATNLLRDGFRRRLLERRIRGRTVPVPSEEALAIAEQRVDLRRAVSRLPRRQRQLVVFHYYLDLPVREVAASLGISEGTAKSALHRARRTLARALGEPQREESDVAG